MNPHRVLLPKNRDFILPGQSKILRIGFILKIKAKAQLAKISLVGPSFAQNFRLSPLRTVPMFLIEKAMDGFFVYNGVRAI